MEDRGNILNRGMEDQRQQRKRKKERGRKLEERKLKPLSFDLTICVDGGVTF